MNASSKARKDRTITRLVGATIVGLTVTAINLMQACGFSPRQFEGPAQVYDILDQSQYVDETDAERRIIIDQPGWLRVEQGSSCGSAPHAASSKYIGLRVLDHDVLPPNYDGTVFLNGWHLEYLNSDHHVVGLGSTIFNIAQLNDTLVWDAGGVLSDENGDDPYKWCYSYTVVAWARNQVLRPRDMFLGQPHMDIGVVHADQSGSLIFVEDSGQGAVQSIPASVKLKGEAPAAVLLAGFGQSFVDSDHHILQLGFDLGKTKIHGKKAKRIKWTAQSILKDNDEQRYQLAAEVVSILRGSSIHVTHPASAVLESTDDPSETLGVKSNDVSLSPRASRFCGALIGYGASFTYTYSISGLPYTYALPMLTGWEMHHPCGDEHVKHVGASIDDFSYVKTPGGTGTLSYTVRMDLGDDDDFPGAASRVQVDVLGIEPIVPVIFDPRPPIGLPD